MTIEEVIHLFEEMWELMWKEMRSTTYSDIKESGNDIKFLAAYNTIIKLLKKESCEDCISRKHIQDKYKTCADMLHEDAAIVMEWVNDAPLVTPQSKTGHWITYNHGLGVSYFKCSECGGMDGNTEADKGRYCKWCGAKMVEEK